MTRVGPPVVYRVARATTECCVPVGRRISTGRTPSVSHRGRDLTRRANGECAAGEIAPSPTSPQNGVRLGSRGSGRSCSPLPHAGDQSLRPRRHGRLAYRSSRLLPRLVRQQRVTVLAHLALAEQEVLTDLAFPHETNYRRPYRPLNTRSPDSGGTSGVRPASGAEPSRARRGPSEAVGPSRLPSQVAVAMNKKAVSAGVNGATVLLTTTSAVADPSVGAMSESTLATGNNAEPPNGETTMAGNDDHVPAGNRKR